MRTVTIKYDSKKAQYFFSDQVSGMNEVTDHFPPCYGKLFVLRQALFFALEHKCDEVIDRTCSPPKRLLIKEGAQQWIE